MNANVVAFQVVHMNRKRTGTVEAIRAQTVTRVTNTLYAGACALHTAYRYAQKQ
jgi:hypothetical protein